ncbi:MAG: YggT family protein [Gammaproteobacteria bacterium]|nr:MAG: YggT family protein [Gammaproteobacteria bacterium]
MNQAISGAGFFIIQTILTLLCLAAMLRFIIQAVRADFYNPICQAIVKITDPVLKPIRMAIPTMGGLDLAALVVALALQLLLLMLLFSGLPFMTALVISPFRLLMLVFDIYFWALLIVVILSWVSPGNRHPGALLLYQITEPLLAPVRRIIPPVGGLDFSILAVFLLLMVVREFLVPGIAAEFGIPRQLLR